VIWDSRRRGTAVFAVPSTCGKPRLCNRPLPHNHVTPRGKLD
jgi:hypothetical protein